MEYRKDIQILRGIAVLLVVLFHLEIAGFKSGFLGVDVFFVISGFLMAVMYRADDKADFFMKRARRLLPAYFATVIVALIAAAVVTTPNDYSQILTQSQLAVAFLSNIGFWSENSYFDHEAFKPLLHLWSLGVEIQFYIFVPVIVWAIRRGRFVYPVLVFVSAAACFVVVTVSPKTSFFMMPLRLWQFMIGFGVASYLKSVGRTKLDRFSFFGALALLGIVLLPFVGIDGGSPSFLRGHPGLASLLISVSTGSVLLFGLPARVEGGFVSDVLERLGGYSYSIYLAHFPVIVLFLYRPFSGTVLHPPDVASTFSLIGVVAVAASALYLLVEKPFRKDLSIGRTAFVSALLVILIGYSGGRIQDAVTEPGLKLIYGAWSDRSGYRCGKLSRLLHPRSITCEITEPIPSPKMRVLLVGNSHADSIKTVFANSAQGRETTVFFMVDNNPMMAGGVRPERIVDEASKLNARYIVLHYSPGQLNLGDLDLLLELATKSAVRVALVMPVPTWGEHVPAMLWRANTNNVVLPKKTIYDYESENEKIISAGVLLREKGLRVYDIAPTFCSPECALVTNEGRPLYFDSNHLTLSGSAMLSELFDSLISDLLVQ